MLRCTRARAAVVLLAVLAMLPGVARPASAPVAVGGTRWICESKAKVKVKGAGDTWFGLVAFTFGPHAAQGLSATQFLARDVYGPPGYVGVRGTYTADPKGKIAMVPNANDIKDEIADSLYDLADKEGVWLSDVVITLVSQKAAGKVSHKGTCKFKVTTTFEVRARVDGEFFSSKGSWSVQSVGLLE